MIAPSRLPSISRWLMLCLTMLCLANSLRRVDSFFGFSRRNQPSALPSPSRSASAVQTNHKNHHHDRKNTVNFGNKFDIRVALPTRDGALAETFLQCPADIIQTIYSAEQATQLSPTLWRIRFADVNIPAMDTISPVIEMTFEYLPDSRSIAMRSQSLTLSSTQGSKRSSLLSDSSFLASCQFWLDGKLTVEYPSRSTAAPRHEPTGASAASPPGDSGVSCVGHVHYSLVAQKPSIFAFAPSFVLNGAVGIVENLVADFVKKKFSSKLQSAFDLHSRRQSFGVPSLAVSPAT